MRVPAPRDGLFGWIAAWLFGQRRSASTGDGDPALLRSVLDAAPAAIMVQSADGSVAFWSRGAERLFGWESAETIGQSPPMLLPEDRPAEAALRHRILAGNESFRMPRRFRHRGGEPIDLLVSAVPHRDSAGAAIGVVSVFDETTSPPRDKAIDDAPHARSMTAPELSPQARPGSAAAPRSSPAPLLAQVSHDLRQPLHALGLLTSALERRAKDAEIRGLAKDASTLVRSLQRSFERVLDFARLEDGQVGARPTAIRAGEVLGPLALEFAPIAHEQGLAFRYVESTAALRSDPVLLQRLLRQLLDNAMKFAPRANGARGKVLLGARRRGNRLRIIVADSGIGIPPDQIDAVFAPFFQSENGRAAGGVGLGLAIARRLAVLLDADIAVRSEPGKGSRFWIDLETTAAAPEPPRAP